MPKLLSTNAESFVLLSRQNGVTLIPAQTQLTRLNYFDGKFLRAADLQTEQRYLRNLVQLSNQAGGNGVAHGFDLELGAGDTLNVGPGLAIDPAGRVLLLPEHAPVKVQELIERSQVSQRLALSKSNTTTGGFANCDVQSETPSDVPRATELYLIVISHAEALCGQEDVFGKLCEEACETGSDRPFLVEGIVIRAVPLVLKTPLHTSKAVSLTRTHQRSLVASAYFEDERQRIASLISKAGLASDAWCFGAEAATGDGVPIGVLARNGNNTLFLDAWTARRELIDTPAKRYWQWRMAMRPWDVFLAQVLQFQCQLRDLFKRAPEPGGTVDPCQDERRLISDAADAVAQLTSHYERVSQMLTQFNAFSANTEFRESLMIQGGVTQYGDLQKKLHLARQSYLNAPQERMLIRGGIIELPSAGYLPVTPGEALTINRQVRMMLGEGVDLRFCIVRPDYVPHALEEAQHMERISLLEGLDDPQHKPPVDILVPDGQLLEDARRSPGNGFEATVSLMSFATDATVNRSSLNNKDAASSGLDETSDETGAQRANTALKLKGVARTETLPSGGGALHLAAIVKQKASTTPGTVSRATVGKAMSAESSRKSAKARKESDTETDTQPDVFARLDSFIAESLQAHAAASELDESDLAAAGTAQSDEAETAEESHDNMAEPERKSAAILDRTSAAIIVNPPPPPRTNSPGTALWLTMRCERDLFGLNRGDSSHVELRLVIGIGARQRSLELRGQGDFSVVQAAATTGAAKRLSGRLSILGAEILREAGHQLASKAVAFELNASVQIEPYAQAQGTRMLINFTDDEGARTITFRAVWGEEPLQVASELYTTLRKSRHKLLGATMKANPDVLEVGNAAHTQALDALHLISLTLNNPSFVDTASQLLFPPPPPLTDELIVRGTRDWVLFHRRRPKDCGTDHQRPAPAATRRYQVYEVLLENPEESLPIIRRALRNPTSAIVSRFNFRPVTMVEYGAGTPSLTSDLNLVLHDWENVNPGNALGYGAIASQGAAANEGENLALGRLQRMEEAVASVSHPIAELISEVLPNVPAPLAVPGTDGIIVLITAKDEVKTVCHSVYRAIHMDAFLSAVEKIKAGRIQEAIQRDELLPLSPALFNEGTADAVGDSLHQVSLDWTSGGGGKPRAAAVVSRQDVTDPAVLAIRIEQAKKIQQEIGPGGDAPFNLPTPGDLPTDCAVFTVISAEVTLNNAVEQPQESAPPAQRKTSRKGSKG